METGFENPPVIGGFSSLKGVQVMQSFDVSLVVNMNKLLNSLIVGDLTPHMTSLQCHA